jgi:hypothetical protein
MSGKKQQQQQPVITIQTGVSPLDKTCPESSAILPQGPAGNHRPRAPGTAVEGTATVHHGNTQNHESGALDSSAAPSSRSTNDAQEIVEELTLIELEIQADQNQDTRVGQRLQGE